MASTTTGPDVSSDETSGRAPDALSERLVVMLSHERSGSHFVANMLRSSGKLVSVDEVCNFNAVDPSRSRLSFFRFRHEYQLKNPELAYRPESQSLTAFCDRYFAHLLASTKAAKVLVDIKYGHVHNFEIGWWPSETRPFLAKYLESRNVAILHLVRRDPVAATVSNFVAKKTGVWHRHAEMSGGQETPETQRKKYTVPSKKIVHDALALQRENDNFFDWLSTNRCCHIAYEDCSRESHRKDTMKAVFGFLGLGPQADYPSSLVKVTPPLKDVVENYDELQHAIGLFGQGRLDTAK